MDQSADWINTLPPAEHVVKFSLVLICCSVVYSSLLIDQQVESESEERPLVDYKLAVDRLIDLAD